MPNWVATRKSRSSARIWWRPRQGGRTSRNAIKEDDLDLSAAALLEDIYQERGETEKAASLARRMSAAIQ